MTKHNEHSAPTILIVDDDLKLQQLLSRYLGEQGYVTAVAVMVAKWITGYSAITRHGHNEFDATR